MPHLHFTFPEPIKRELERLVPLRERSRFVGQATARALQMRHLQKTLLSKRYVGSYPEINPDRWVEKLRQKGRKIRKSA